jgi:hypothetical protein
MKTTEITQRMFLEAKRILRLFELQERKTAIMNALPELEEGMVLEYYDLGGGWYEYTKDLQKNPHFNPIKARVRMEEEFLKKRINSDNSQKGTAAIAHLFENIEDFGEAKYKDTVDGGKSLTYNCVNLAVAIKAIDFALGRNATKPEKDSH